MLLLPLFLAVLAQVLGAGLSDLATSTAIALYDSDRLLPSINATRHMLTSFIPGIAYTQAPLDWGNKLNARGDGGLGAATTAASQAERVSSAIRLLDGLEYNADTQWAAAVPSALRDVDSLHRSMLGGAVALPDVEPRAAALVRRSIRTLDSAL
ncbi:hypothetical protein Ct61P_14548 [Colletotrichum tofieldiae]|nr:hypothetical protein Ct61P_14548 [Colletotrichum tofieldiae]